MKASEEVIGAPEISISRMILTVKTVCPPVIALAFAWNGCPGFAKFQARL